jgi:ubiquinone/menaquinone biosynthesis C-methylase UbiE
MGIQVFDEHAAEYDGWFLKNENVLRSEVALVARALGSPGRTLSVGCGSGLFEMILKKEYGIVVEEGIEPSGGMGAIARKRGLQVIATTAEEMAVETGAYDTLLFNGSPSYIDDLGRAFANARRVLKPGGRIVVLDVPKESSYALLYNLGGRVGNWDDPIFAGARPADVYPMEFVVSARWRSTPEKVALLKEAGFGEFTFFQTLTRHPVYTNESVEEPSEGFDRGDYVAIVARAPTA